MEYLPKHLRIPFDVVLEGVELEALFEECRQGKAHVMIMNCCHEGRNACYRLRGSRTDGSAAPTPRIEKDLKKPVTHWRTRLKRPIKRSDGASQSKHPPRVEHA